MSPSSLSTLSFPLPSRCQVQHLINHFLSAVCLHFYTLLESLFYIGIYIICLQIMVSLIGSCCFHPNYFEFGYFRHLGTLINQLNFWKTISIKFIKSSIDVKHHQKSHQQDLWHAFLLIYILLCL